MAPPRKLTDAEKTIFLRMTASGVLGNAAAQHCGTTLRTVQREMERDPEFAEDVAAARDAAKERVEEVLYTAALAGEPWAVKKWLEAHDRETYGKQETTINIEHKTTTELEIGERLAGITQMKERLALAAGDPEEVTLERTDG